MITQDENESSSGQMKRGESIEDEKRRKYTLCANLCCWTLRAVAVGRMRERDPEYGDTEGTTANRVLDDNARCMM